MGLLLEHRDYVPNGMGSVTGTAGGEDLLNEVLFRLTARRGGLPFLPELGSRMYLLRNEKPSDWQSLARQYAAEALSGLNDLAVTQARVTQEGDRLWVAVDMEWRGTPLTVECEA